MSTFLNDIIKDSYFIVMKRETTHDKLTLLRRFLKMKYNISIGMESLKKRDSDYKKGTKLD